MLNPFSTSDIFGAIKSIGKKFLNFAKNQFTIPENAGFIRKYIGAPLKALSALITVPLAAIGATASMLAVAAVGSVTAGIIGGTAQAVGGVGTLFYGLYRLANNKKKYEDGLSAKDIFKKGFKNIGIGIGKLVGGSLVAGGIAATTIFAGPIILPAITSAAMVVPTVSIAKAAIAGLITASSTIIKVLSGIALVVGGGILYSIPSSISLFSTSKANTNLNKSHQYNNNTKRSSNNKAPAALLNQLGEQFKNQPQSITRPLPNTTNTILKSNNDEQAIAEAKTFVKQFANTPNATIAISPNSNITRTAKIWIMLEQEGHHPIIKTTNQELNTKYPTFAQALTAKITEMKQQPDHTLNSSTSLRNTH